MKKKDFLLGYICGHFIVLFIWWLLKDQAHIKSDTIIVPDVTITITDQGIDTIYDYHK